jgi:hypothetical protein
MLPSFFLPSQGLHCAPLSFLVLSYSALSRPVPTCPISITVHPILLISPPHPVQDTHYTHHAPRHLYLDPGSALLHPLDSTLRLTDSAMAQICTLLFVPHH